MMAKLIMEFVDLAIELIHTHLKGDEAKNAFLDFIQKGYAAWEDHTGEPLDPKLIRAESRL